jgi:hypothetical protein
MSLVLLKVYEIFKARLSEPEAAAILEYIDEKTEKNMKRKRIF